MRTAKNVPPAMVICGRIWPARRTQMGHTTGRFSLPCGYGKTATVRALTHLPKIVSERSRPSTDRADTVGVADVNRLPQRPPNTSGHRNRTIGSGNGSTGSGASDTVRTAGPNPPRRALLPQCTPLLRSCLCRRGATCLRTILETDDPGRSARVGQTGNNAPV